MSVCPSKRYSYMTYTTIVHSLEKSSHFWKVKPSLESSFKTTMRWRNSEIQRFFFNFHSNLFFFWRYLKIWKYRNCFSNVMAWAISNGVFSSEVIQKDADPRREPLCWPFSEGKSVIWKEQKGYVICIFLLLIVRKRLSQKCQFNN